MVCINRVGLGLLASTVVLVLAACGGGGNDPAAIANDTSFSSRGDAAAGELVFQASCAACHSTGTDKLVGPGLAGAFSPEGPTEPDGVNYNGMLPNNKPRTETNVAAWITSGGQGQIGVMPAQNLDDQQLADVIAYLRTLQK